MDVVEVVAEKQGEGRGHQKLEDALRETGETGKTWETGETGETRRTGVCCLSLLSSLV